MRADSHPCSMARFDEIVATEPSRKRIAKKAALPVSLHKDDDMNKDQVKGNIKQAAGKVQETAGKVVGSKEQEAKGLGKQVAGKAQETYGDAKEVIKDSNKKH